MRIKSACPSCGTVAERHTYDIGSGPELSCASCEWCWGADGQPLQPLDQREMRRAAWQSVQEAPEMSPERRSRLRHLLGVDE